MQTKVKTADEIIAMRESGHMLATVLEYLKANIKPGMTTQDMDDLAVAETKRLGGEPGFLGYQGFPRSLCISINDEVVHGIPSKERVIKDGDLVSLDYGVRYKGMVTDAARSVIVGTPKQRRHIELIERTAKSLDAGIAAVHDRVRTGDIGSSVEGYLKKFHYGIVRDLVGHGVGHHLHEDPNIPNTGRADTGPWLDAGMTIAIEPMVTLGTERVYVADDGWTIITADHSWAAHFEDTVLITKDGAEILTRL
ncbi:MAG: Methionine aminopeptidase [Candidatus Saccharibacteria bacterium]|nr:Methionine aminopeptidase [Candidatus Saccharibacteria bacterium]